MVLDEVFNLLVEGVEDTEVCGDNGGFVAITACEVLRGDDCYAMGRALNEYNLAVVVGEVGVFDDLCEKSPQTKCLLCGFEIQKQVDRVHIAAFGNKIQSPQKLFRNGKRGLPNGALAYLREYPFNDVSHLQCVGEITLRLVRLQGLKIVFYLYTAFH